MSELHSVQHMLEEAKRAANAGELASADVLLQDAARIQEAELGPLHPELANTVNNLAIVAEMEGRLGDAETYYRRAVAIASASLPSDDPMVASSRKNLEDFCRERGLSFDPSAASPAIPHTEHQSDGVAHDQASGETNTPADVELVHAVETSTLKSDTRSAPDSTTDAFDRRRLSAPATATTRSLAVVAIGLVALVAVMLLVTRPWSARESPPHGRTPEPAQPAAAETAPPRPLPAPAPIEQPQPPTVASRDDKSGAAAASPPAPGRSSGGMTLITSQLCRSLSVGSNWRCDPAGQSAAPGPLVLYTRVKSPRAAVVIHQWYLGGTLRKSARLTILANTTDGYRTYSRQTVKSGEDWRVEVRDAAGDLLYEQRVSVR
jgi:DUF2914 family protein/tetratricopeptide repeat protein